ncbi:MAG: XRE family transcriptional regulator [Deltaproteobacteria bacterium]|nr:XRE family transcriptional regulator [Deltaproteobacteria bacterium]
MKQKEEIPVIKGSGNVFADIGCGDAAELQVKAELARQIYRRIKALHLTPMEVAQQLDLQPAEVSQLANAQYTGFSTDRLLRILTVLGINVDIVLSPQYGRKKNKQGTVRVVALE